MQIHRSLSMAAALAVVVSIIAFPASSQPLDLILPTSNDALLRNDGPSFYQYTNRTFNGVRSKPWQGGKYGFVRNPRHTSAGIIYTRFHEGVDIKPVYRDWRGEPLDTVRTIDDGYVVHINTVEGYSSYGKYVVVEHWWSGSPFYSLYAHLNDVHVQIGETVAQGDRLGRIGYTGRGLNKTRAHLHFEINMMLNQSFSEWFDGHYRSTNRHDVYNGINLAGLDVSELYLSLQRDPALTIDQFVLSREIFYNVSVPNNGHLDLFYRYGWLDQGSETLTSDVSSWEISFTADGLPVRVEPSSRSISKPTVTMAAKAPAAYGYMTKGRLAGSGDRYYLSKSGHRYAALLTLIGEDRPFTDVYRAASRRAPENVDQADAGVGRSDGDRHQTNSDLDGKEAESDGDRSVMRRVNAPEDDRIRTW